MEPLVTKVPRNLESKPRLFGFELADVLTIFLYLSLTNAIFGTTRLKAPVVWGGTLCLALVMFRVKKGKPDRYLEHLFQYVVTPDILSASAPDLEYQVGPFHPGSAHPLSKEKKIEEQPSIDRAS